MTADMPLEARVEAVEALQRLGGQCLNTAGDTDAVLEDVGIVRAILDRLPGLLAERDELRASIDLSLDLTTAGLAKADHYEGETRTAIESIQRLEAQLAEARAALDGEGERIALAIEAQLPTCTRCGDLTTTPVDAEDARVVKVRHELGQDGVRT